MTPHMSTHDYFVRVPGTVLPDIVLEHLYTEQDPAIQLDADVLLGRPGRRAGSTEWTGALGAVPITIAWDWVELDDGQITLLRTVGPRTNIMVLDVHGYDLPQAKVGDALWAMIEAAPWQSEVARALRESSNAAPAHAFPACAGRLYS